MSGSKKAKKGPVKQLQEKPSKEEFLIVGIGASAGGIQALQAFFERVLPDSGMAYVVILHLSPNHDSKLAEVLQQVCKIPVMQVKEKIAIKKNHVYVVPPDKHLSIEEDYIAIAPNMTVEDRRAPVDIFLRTLADQMGPRAVSVILSGTGANGSMGLKRIKERGGTAFVQNPREAEFNEMPRNAIATELIDEVLPVADIPARILLYNESLHTINIAATTKGNTENHLKVLNEIFTHLRMRTGHDFSNYKHPTLLRRLERRINVKNLSGLDQYAEYINAHPEEPKALLKDLLISVTNFFRDKEAFDILDRNIIPSILKEKTGADQVRIWVAGCATGEEAYSIAMLCAERLTDVPDAPMIQIFATDIDEAAIAHAREGYYTINDAADVSPERLRRFFSKEKDGYRIKREIRETVLFAYHNFLKDPPFSRLDMVSCRNVLIYLNRVAQQRAIETFHFAVKPGGYFISGPSESLDGASDLFSVFNRNQHIFQSRSVAVRTYPVPYPFPTQFREISKSERQPYTGPAPGTTARYTYGELHQQLLEEYAPPSLIINEDYDIVHLTEKAGKYLQFTGGEISQNLLNVINPELRLELRSALYQALQKKSAVEARDLSVTINDNRETLNIHVRPVTKEGVSTKSLILVIFESVAGQEEKEVILSTDEPANQQLEEELIKLKTELRSSGEQFDFQAEELKASNEELQAMNEELRSAAEELETSKEELQSINEELRTVNQELKVKIEETSITSDNLQNLINSTDIGTIFLDRSFNVALFTPAARNIFNLIPADFGRPLSDITGRLVYPEIISDAETVLDKLITTERELETVEGTFYLVRMSPYRTKDDRIKGVVISFIDITKRKVAERGWQQANERMRLVVESAKDYAIFSINADRKVTSWNTGAQTIFGYYEEEILGKSADILFVPEDREKQAPINEIEKARTGGRAENERWHSRKDGSRFYGSGVVSPLFDDDRQLIGFVKIMRDLTVEKLTEETLRISEEKYRTLFTSIDQGFYIIEVMFDENDHPFDYRFMEANNAFERLTGLENVVGRTIRELVPGQEQFWYDTFGKVSKTGKQQKFEKEAIVPGLYYEVNAFPTGDPGQNNVAVLFNDITERRRNEANLAFLAEVSQDLLRLDSVDETMSELSEKIGKYFRASGCMFSEVREAQGLIVPKHVWHRPDVPGLKGAYHYENFHNKEFEKAGKAGEIVLVSDGHNEPGVKEDNLALIGVRAYINVPLNQHGKWVFNLTVSDTVARHWREDESDLLLELLTRIWIRLERVQVDEALRRSEERIRTLTNVVPQIIWTNTADGKADYFNQRWYDYSGLSYEESAGPGWEAIIHPEDAQASVERWKKALAAGELFDKEYRLRRHDGRYYWFISRNVPLKNKAGIITGWFGSATDISALKNAEEALRISEERLRITMESALDYAIITTNKEGLVEGWNTGAEQIFGFTPEEIRGKPADIIFTPEDRQNNIPEIEMKTAREIGLAEDERWHLRKDGSRFFASGVMRPILDKGLAGYVKIARDMTGAQQAQEQLRVYEERYRIALASANMGTWDWDIQKDQLIWNDQHYYILGMSPDNAVHPIAYFLRFVHPDDRKKTEEEIREAVRNKGSLQLEFRIMRVDDKQIRWMYSYGNMVNKGEDGALRMVGVVFDITKRKKLEQQKDEFLSIASHELKTPVTTISAYGELLERMFSRDENSTEKGFISKMNGQVSRLKDLINDLLDSTRISEGQIPLYNEHFHIGELLTQLEEQFQQISSEHKLIFRCQDNVPLNADKRRIEQVITNLISNAIKYSPKGGTVIVNCKSLKDEMQISVSDEGIGIPKVEQTNLFSRFYRIHNTGMSEFPGIGLGLYISAGFVHRHGGKIWVESTPGKGSVFYFTLPYQRSL